jgi:adenylylsulfate kinase
MVIDPDDGQSPDQPANGSSPRQTPELARRCTDAGLIVIFAYASPLRADRDALRDRVRPERFIEVHVATSLQRCRERDVRGAYDWAHQVPTYEAPVHPEATVSLDELEPEEAAAHIMRVLESKGLLPSSYAL